MAFNQDLAQKLTSGILISTTSGNDLPTFSSDSTNFELQGTDWAMMFNSMTSTQRDALTDPANGMVFYNSTTGTIQAREAGAWVSLSNAAGGIFQAAAGTAAAPGYTFTGDTNTGIYRSAADIMDFSAGGFRQASVVFTNNAVNYFGITGAPTGGLPYFTNAPTIFSEGTDTHIGLNLLAKGLGAVNIMGDTNNGEVRFWNSLNTFYIGLSCANPTANKDFTLPNDYPTLDGIPILVSTAGAMTYDPAGAILHTRVQIPTAAVKTMFATPVQLLAAPGATKAYMIHKALLNVKYNSATYTSGGAIGIVYSPSAAAAMEASVDAALLVGPTQSTIESVTGLIGNDNLSAVVNNAVFIENATANFATGNSDLYVDLWYSVVTAP
jgi:hypothetical protein